MDRQMFLRSLPYLIPTNSSSWPPRTVNFCGDNLHDDIDECDDDASGATLLLTNHYVSLEPWGENTNTDENYDDVKKMDIPEEEDGDDEGNNNNELKRDNSSSGQHESYPETESNDLFLKHVTRYGPAYFFRSPTAGDNSDVCPNGMTNCATATASPAAMTSVDSELPNTTGDIHKSANCEDVDDHHVHKRKESSPSSTCSETLSTSQKISKTVVQKLNESTGNFDPAMCDFEMAVLSKYPTIHNSETNRSYRDNKEDFLYTISNGQQLQCANFVIFFRVDQEIFQVDLNQILHIEMEILREKPETENAASSKPPHTSQNHINNKYTKNNGNLPPSLLLGFPNCFFRIFTLVENDNISSNIPQLQLAQRRLQELLMIIPPCDASSSSSATPQNVSIQAATSPSGSTGSNTFRTSSGSTTVLEAGQQHLSERVQKKNATKEITKNKTDYNICDGKVAHVVVCPGDSSSPLGTPKRKRQRTDGHAKNKDGYNNDSGDSDSNSKHMYMKRIEEHRISYFNSQLGLKSLDNLVDLPVSMYMAENTLTRCSTDTNSADGANQLSLPSPKDLIASIGFEQAKSYTSNSDLLLAYEKNDAQFETCQAQIDECLNMYFPVKKQMQRQKQKMNQKPSSPSSTSKQPNKKFIKNCISNAIKKQKEIIQERHWLSLLPSRG